MYTRGYIPGRGEETELYHHTYTRKGFFGPFAHLYKTRNPGEPVRQDRELGPFAIDLNEARPSDLERPDGLPMPVLSNGNVTLYVSRRREPMPFCWRNSEADELYFIHRGACLFETEFGRLPAEPGDFVYLPRDVVFRVRPQADDTLHLIMETKGLLELAERYHREHGTTNSGLDMTRLVVPEPGEPTDGSSAEYRVLTKVGGGLYSAFFDYDPVGVTVGWVGDPLVFKLSCWDVPAARLPSTPPTSAVFVTEEGDCVVTVHTPSAGPGRRSGPPAHTNDFEELWLLHSASSPERARMLGVLRWSPTGWTQPGARRTGGDGARREPDPAMMNVNIDVKGRFRLCQEAEPYVLDARQAAGVA